VSEAEAQYDFTGRTDRELSFKRGDTLVVFSQVSPDWWEGAFQGKEGLIPDKYISVKRRYLSKVPNGLL
jgi:SLIT-ROBO Rho GTPase activating protein